MSDTTTVTIGFKDGAITVDKEVADVYSATTPNKVQWVIALAPPGAIKSAITFDVHNPFNSVSGSLAQGGFLGQSLNVSTGDYKYTIFFSSDSEEWSLDPRVRIRPVP